MIWIVLATLIVAVVTLIENIRLRHYSEWLEIRLFILYKHVKGEDINGKN